MERLFSLAGPLNNMHPITFEALQRLRTAGASIIEKYYPRTNWLKPLTPDQRATFITRTYLHLVSAIFLFIALEALWFTTPVANAVFQWVPDPRLVAAFRMTVSNV